VLYFTVFSCQMVVYLLSTFNGRPPCLTTKRHVMRIDQSQRSLAIGHMINGLVPHQSKKTSLIEPNSHYLMNIQSLRNFINLNLFTEHVHC